MLKINNNTRLEVGLPTTITEEEVESLLGAPNLDSALEVRDKAMLELLYSCGLRVSELVSISISQVNLRQDAVRIIGKGSRERIVPMSAECSGWISLLSSSSTCRIIER